MDILLRIEQLEVIIMSSVKFCVELRKYKVWEFFEVFFAAKNLEAFF